MVLRARGNAPEAKAALGELCEAYWTPVFRFLCRDSRREDHSRELAQEFFSRLLGGSGVDGADPEKGRFRSYLLGALKHFLAEQKRNAKRQKRGGDAILQSIDTGGTETSPGLQISDPSTAASDAWFDREWALAIMDRGLKTVQANFKNSGKEEQFHTLKPWLIGDTENLSQTDAAKKLGLSAGAVKVAIHRLRKEFREVIRSEIAQTVTSPEEIAEELRYLIDILT